MARSEIKNNESELVLKPQRKLLHGVHWLIQYFTFQEFVALEPHLICVANRLHEHSYRQVSPHIKAKTNIFFIFKQLNTSQFQLCE